MTSKRAGSNSSFEAQPHSLSLGERSHENSSETSTASKHICLPWEPRSTIKTHLPVHLQSAGDLFSLPEMRWMPVSYFPATLSCNSQVPATSHPIPALPAVHCISLKSFPESNTRNQMSKDTIPSRMCGLIACLS